MFFPAARRLWQLAPLLAALVLLGANSSRPLRIGMPLQPNTLNPVISSQYAENYIEEAVFSGLAVLDDRGDLQPDLAVAVPTKENHGISPDGKTLTYHLRRGVKWQDGAPFTSRDVAFTFEKMRDPHVPFALGTWYEIVERIEAPDPYTVVIRLKQPSADATSELFVNGEFGMILPEHLLRNVTDFRSAPFSAAPIGTGPYIVDHWERGYSLDLRANPAYFRGAPHIDRIHIVFLGDQNTLALQKRTGELDFVQNLPISQLPAFANAPMTTRVVPSYILDYVIANLRVAPLDDARVRRALSAAIDRGVLARKAYHGAAVLADGFVAPWTKFHSSAPTNAVSPNLGEARKLLDEAGWHPGPDGIRRKNGIPLEFSLTTIAGQIVLLNEAVEIQAAWRAIGANVAVRSVQSNLLFGPDGILAHGGFALALVIYGELPWPDITDNVASAAQPPRGSNFSRFADGDVDRWLHESGVTSDVSSRRAVVAKIESRLRDQAPEMPVLWERYFYAWSSDLLGVRPETANSDFWNVYDWEWKK
jgi:peptide/nickel transport system substrate-binding protein